MGLHCIYLLFITTLSAPPPPPPGQHTETGRLRSLPWYVLRLTYETPLRPSAPGWSMAEAQTLAVPAPSGGVVGDPPRTRAGQRSSRTSVSTASPAGQADTALSTPAPPASLPAQPCERLGTTRSNLHAGRTGLPPGHHT